MPTLTWLRALWLRVRITPSNSKNRPQLYNPQLYNPQLYNDVALLYSAATEPDWVVSGKGHGRTERRQVWVSAELAGSSDLPGLSGVVMVKKRVSGSGKASVASVQYAVSSRPDRSP